MRVFPPLFVFLFSRDDYEIIVVGSPCFIQSVRLKQYGPLTLLSGFGLSRVCTCLWSDRKALYKGCFVFLFYTVSLLDIPHSSFAKELPRVFVCC
jgi:hypothetical protein